MVLMQGASSLESLMVRSFAWNRYRPPTEYQSGWFSDGNSYGFDVLIDNPVCFSAYLSQNSGLLPQAQASGHQPSGGEHEES